jgi:endonuclease YncB( thermonuclease family)
MRRREFMAALAISASATTATARTTRNVDYGAASAATGEIPSLVFGSTASLVDANYDELTDSSVVSVWAEDTATNNDSDGDGYATIYAEDTPIPVAATDWNVAAFGALLVDDRENWQPGNEEFLLNVWDDALGGSGTVYWDEGHGQYYTLSKFSKFESYAENEGYTVNATTKLSKALKKADAAVITSPSDAFTSSELSDLGDFVANGGWLFLHDQSDYGNYDETANLNDIAGYLDLDFRFNDDEVTDPVQNGGDDYQPRTDEFNTSFSYFGARDGLGLDPSKTYTVDVADVIDGDTVKVTFADGSQENIRILGTDTPEKSSNSQYERVQEWEGIESNSYLEGWAADATDFGTQELGGKTVELSFDPEEPVRDAFDRVLGYLHYDASGDGSRDTNYNYQLVKQGWARIYGSGLSKHESFWDAEADARANGRRVWTESDPENSTEIRDNPVDDLFFPETASVRTDSGGVADSRVPVYAETSATQDLDGGHSYSGDIPLVAVDDAAGVAVVGGPIVDESYEQAEGYSTDTSSYGNFPFLANLVDSLSEISGDVLIDGGHGQFAANYALSNEDAAYWMRYLEGQDVGFEQMNEVSSENLSRGRSLVVCTPTDGFTQSEIDAVNGFLADGGSVVLLGSGQTTAAARANLNDLAAGLGTDLRVNEDQVLDDTNNVGTSSDVPETTNFDTSFPLFDAYTPGTSSDHSVSIPTISPDGETLNDEYVDVKNDGSSSLDMTGWTLEDEAGYTYQFPDGFSLGAGDTVRVHTGSGTDSSTDLYWGSGSPIWNNDSDTAYLYDDASNLAAEKTYPSYSCDADVCVDEINEDGSTLNDEWVDFGNSTSSDQDMTGWTVEDEASHTYQFPDGFTLGAGDEVRLHTGSGTDSSTDLYWGSGSAIWNNSGDTVSLYDDTGTLHTSRSY